MSRTEPNPMFPGDTYLVRVNPKSRRIPDPITGEELWDDLWYVEWCVGDDVLTSMEAVRDGLEPFMEISDDRKRWLTDLYVYHVITHPRSPYGLGLKVGDIMLVAYHGWWYTRDDNGVMTRDSGEPRIPWWPTPHEWRVAVFNTRQWARRNGMLAGL
jgi:hypothetical protein